MSFQKPISKFEFLTYKVNEFQTSVVVRCGSLQWERQVFGKVTPQQAELMWNCEREKFMPSQKD